MLNSFLKISAAAFLLVFFIVGCSKNDTSYFADEQDAGLAIFSDNTNELMTCYVNGNAWRTNDRITYTGTTNPGTNYEVNIQRLVSNGLQDTLSISWDGRFSSADQGFDEIIVLLPIAKNFSFRNFSAWQGRRLSIDSTNGAFTANIFSLNANIQRRGRGNIYFHTAALDSIGPDNFVGKMSGLFDADFGDFKITRGRFDHSLEGGNVIF